jgi:hypothetical protein
LCDLPGRRRAALRQIAYLGGDHSKAAALLPGARRFHRSVQRQDVGLERCCLTLLLPDFLLNIIITII